MSDSLQPATDTTLPGAPRPEGLAVPEHVWFDAAIEALGREDAPAQRLAALRMLKQAPRSWDAVMMLGLTTQDPELQLAAVEALAAHVKLDASRQAGFARLGKLTVWTPVAREAWSVAWQALGGVPEPASGIVEAPRTELTRAPEAAPAVDGGAALAEAHADRDALRREAEGLRAEMEALRLACQLAEERLAAQVEATHQLEVALARPSAAPSSDRDQLARALREREAELENLAMVAWRAERDRRRWALAAACGSLAAVGIIAALVVGRSPAMATEPGGRVVAAAEAEGYRKAIVALAAEASRIEADGDRKGAAGAWGCIARIAVESDEGIAQHAAVRLRELASSEERRPAEAGKMQRLSTLTDDPLSHRDEGFQDAPVVRSARVERAVSLPARAAVPKVPPPQPRVALPRRVAAPSRAVAPRVEAPRPVERSLIPDDVRAKLSGP